MFEHIHITGHNATSGVYRIHLNFNDSREYLPTGSVAIVNAQVAIVGKFPKPSSSRLTAGLESALGSITLDLNDTAQLPYHDGTDWTSGRLFRSCIETARENGFKIHCIIARYSNEVIPAFQEFVFAGSVHPHEITVGHRFIDTTGARAETITCNFTPAARLDEPLSVLAPGSGGPYEWTQADMHQPLDPGESDGCLPNWLAVVSEPGIKNNFLYTNPVRLTDLITASGTYGGTDEEARQATKTLAYGAHPLSTNPDIGSIRDTVGTGPFPKGNWNCLLSTAITKCCNASYVEWDGVMPAGTIAAGGGMEFREMNFDNGAQVNSDVGAVQPSDFIINWNYFFGYSPFGEGATFTSPAAYDKDQTTGDALRGFAALLKCRVDKTGEFNSVGLPIIRFVPIGSSAGTFPDLEEIDGSSSEDTFITDADGVRVTRRGYSGSVLCPANAKNPVEIEVPLGFHTIAYETAPAFDASRITVNAELALKDQWMCGHRGSLMVTNEDGDLNPEGWVVGAHLFYYSGSYNVLHFPESLNYHDEAFGGQDYDNDTEAIYHQTGWKGYYPVQAVYERDPGELDEPAKRKRQINPMISYALGYGRYIRGQRRQLKKKFLGVVAPNWSDIKTGMEYEFTPVDTPVTYAAVEIYRDIDENTIEVLFEEVVGADVELSYKEEGKHNEGNGSINGQGGNTSANDSNNNSLSDTHFVRSRTVKFYSANVVVKTMTMTCFEYYDTDAERTIVQQAFPAPYEGAGSDDGFNTVFYPHYKGSEFGNVEIVGVSPTDTPDYHMQGVSVIKRGSDASAYYVPEFKFWSEDNEDWVILRGLEKTHTNRRLQVHGRIKAYYDTGAGVLVPNWVSFGLGENIPMSNEEIWTDSDLHNGTTGNPALTGTGGAIILDFGARLNPVALSASAALYKEPGSALTYFTSFIGAMPPYVQVPTAREATIQFWHFDPATGQYTPNGQVSPPLLVDPNISPGDWVYIDVWGLVEVIGEDATLA